jgi:hypothetical protein
LEPQLATLRRIDLEWHTVLNWYEYDELSRYDAIKPYKYSDSRHKIFDELNQPNHTRYQGAWGPESLYYNHNSQIGIIHGTDKRAEEIRAWVREQMFNLAPGND